MPRLTPATFRGCTTRRPGTTARSSSTRTGAGSWPGCSTPRGSTRSRPDEGQHGLPLHRLLARSTSPTVAPVGDEAPRRRHLGRPARPGTADGLIRGWQSRGCGDGPTLVNVDPVNLHDWIDELCDVLDVETEVDEGLSWTSPQVAAHNVERPGGAGHGLPPRFAAGAQRRRPGGGRGAGREGAGAGRGLGPAGRRAGPRRHRRHEIPDDSLVDHSTDEYDELTAVSDPRVLGWGHACRDRRPSPAAPRS